MASLKIKLMSVLAHRGRGRSTVIICRPGADPIKNSWVEFDSTLEYLPIRGAKNGHMANLIGQIHKESYC